ncbi:MAG TPA: aminoglycoside phosphotransferase family protein [Solirubrobacterales bacterium]|nr:aminoglycoside phosphotransferase family protein [Solirubrobacterales bacterium]
MSSRRALAAARSVAREQGVPCERAVVAYSGSNVLVHLAPSPVVARVMTGTVALHDDPEVWLAREVEVLKFLEPTGLAVAPSPSVDPGPYEADGLWMTFWARVEVEGRTEADDPVRLGRSLRELHDALSGFSGELAGFRDLQEDIERLRLQLRPSATLGADKIEALAESLEELSDSVFGLSLPTQALHGDATLGNLLSTPEGPVWNDFEDTFRGPVEWDLAGYAMSLEYNGADSDFVQRALAAYGWGDRRELDPFTAAHKVYDEIWHLYCSQ